jgi:hypothetical protein
MDFTEFPKIARLSREIVITEKIDGTNGQIFIGEDGDFLVGSRSRWITPEQDNHGFARWAYEHKEELIAGLGVGKHFGEWWGSGIQRGYGLSKGEKRFSLFNTNRWGVTRDVDKYPIDKPDCCHVVPVLMSGIFTTGLVRDSLDILEDFGSQAAKGFMNPEGIVIFHTAANMMFKKTIKNDEKGKGEL